jgi:hypothetical protein
MSSIKRDVKKKVLPRPEVEKIFGLEIQPTVDPLAGEVGSGGWRFLWVCSAGGDNASRV